MFFKNKFYVILVFLLFFVIFFSKHIYATDLNIEDNFNSIVYSDANDHLGANRLVDINGDGKLDLISTSCCTTVGGKASAGSIWVIFDISSKITGKNQSLDLTNGSNYNVRIDGDTEYGNLGGHIAVGDIDNDGKGDILSSASGASNNGRSYSGSVYIFAGSALSEYSSSTGNVINTSSSGSYRLRIDGPSDNAYSAIPYSETELVDINGDNKDDLIIHVDSVDGSTYKGAVYIIYNSLLGGITGTGNLLDLNTSTSYNIRYDGPTDNGYMGAYAVSAIDLNNNGIKDIMIGDQSSSQHGLYSGSLFVIFDNLISGLSGTGNTVNLATSSNYSIRIDGGQANDTIGGQLVNTSASSTDIDADGKNDLVVAGSYAHTNSRNYSGSVFILNNSLIANQVGTGNTMNLGTSSNYSLRIDGPYSRATLGFSFLSLADTKNLGKLDLIIPSEGNRFSGVPETTLYDIDNSVLNISQTGRTVDLATVSEGVNRYRGQDASAIEQGNLYDINGDGKNDFFISGDWGSYYGRSETGHTHILLNFPHSIISLSPTNTNINASSMSVNGTVSAPKSVTNIAGVQYILDTDSPTATWKECNAIDGAFNSTLESYTCPVMSISQGAHKLFIRAYDAYGSFTARSNYLRSTFTSDMTSPSSNWTTEDGKQIDFRIVNPSNNSFTTDHYPIFTFTQSEDSLTGVSKYQVIMNNSEKEWVYIDNISPQEPGGENVREEDAVYMVYNNQNKTISVHRMNNGQESNALADGAYKWYIKAVDNSGNSINTSTNVLRINSYSAIFSNKSVSFPLSLMQIGNQNKLNISSYNSLSTPTKTLLITTQKPTFFGITNVNAYIKLILVKHHEEENYDETFNFSTVANNTSRFGINVTPELTKGKYKVILSATADTGDYVELPPFAIEIR